MKNYINTALLLFNCIFCINAQNVIFTKDITASKAFNGVFGSATLQIDDAGNDGMITRPLIIAEGFESGLLGTENPFGEQDLNSFSRSVQFSLSADLRDLLNGGTIQTTGDQDYDIIYVNWDNGRDDIRRNAYVLQEVIRWVNQEKADAGSTEQNVVLGQSMGGLIARYALVDMEQDPNQDHDTRLYVSHDAPHQGANIPLGIQYFARHLVDQFVSTPLGDIDLPAVGGGSVTISDINNVFNSVGTRQLLANNINGNFNLDNNAFNSFQTDLQIKGYPQQTRNIAISNGSHCANNQEIQALEELLYLSGDIEPTILLDIIINYFPLLSWAEGLGYAGLAIILEDPAYLAGLLPGRTNLNTRFEAKSLPNVGQTANIYSGRIRITKKIDFLLFTLSYNISVTDRNETNPSAVQLPLDSYPGGAFNVTFDLSELNDIDGDDVDFLVNLNITARTADSFNFIPTTTALDVGSGSITLNNNDYKRVYSAVNPPTGNRTIPFDNFTSSYDTNGMNERHISFNTRNGDWLAAELRENEEVFDCSFVCSDIDITAPSLLCTSATFSVPEGADSVEWTVSPSNSGVSVTSGQGTNIAVLTLTGGYSGQVTVTANMMSDECGDVLSNPLIIWTGKPAMPNSIEGPTSVNTGALVNYQSGGSTGATSYEWWLPFPYESVPVFNLFGQNWQKLSGASSSSSIQVFTGYAGTSGNVQVMGRNSCGIGGARILSVSHGGSGGHIPRPAGEEEYNFVAYPNPSRDLLNVNAIDTSKNNGIYTSLSGGLYDLNGKEVRSVKFYNDKSMIDTNGLNKGVYVLKVYYDNKVETHQIIVE